MGFNPFKIIGGLFGNGPLVKAEGVADQVQDKEAERRFALGWIILCGGIALALIVMALRCG